MRSTVLVGLHMTEYWMLIGWGRGVRYNRETRFIDPRLASKSLRICSTVVKFKKKLLAMVADPVPLRVWVWGVRQPFFFFHVEIGMPGEGYVGRLYFKIVEIVQNQIDEPANAKKKQPENSPSFKLPILFSFSSNFGIFLDVCCVCVCVFCSGSQLTMRRETVKVFKKCN